MCGEDLGVLSFQNVLGLSVADPNPHLHRSVPIKRSFFIFFVCEASAVRSIKVKVSV